MRIVTWNVNSIRARLERLLAFLERHQPDVVCLQELKVTDEVFPFASLREAGYHAAAHGQKTYNGVAILSRTEPEKVICAMDDGTDDPQARLVSARIEDVHVLSAYFPNGKEVGSDKYAYKLLWMKRLRAWLDKHFDPATPVALCGDFNVAHDDKDVANPKAWADTVLTTPEIREALANIRAFGFRDVFREKHPEGKVYSWWDYRRLGFPKNDGLRIDHIYATESLADRLKDASVDRDERKGKGASDHAPVIVEFA